jgi:hypothetical protein
LTIKLPKGNKRECEMEKKEKSPADRQGENRRLLLQASHKAVCVESQNRVQQRNGCVKHMVKRYGWKNKKIPFEKRGFYEITCPICGERNRFIIEAKSIPYHNSRVVNNILNSEYYMARPVTKESRR